MTSEIHYRAAAAKDAFALAELSIMAGDGMFAFLLEDFAPGDMLAGLLAGGIRQEEGGSSWRHCFVAEENGVVVGMINAYPAVWLRDIDKDPLPPDRVQVLDAIDQAQDWQSFLVSGIAVRSPYRRQGIGRHLLTWATEQAQLGGFQRLSANVWEDNTAARALFTAEGFTTLTAVEVSAHPALGHVGGSLVLARVA